MKRLFFVAGALAMVMWLGGEPSVFGESDTRVGVLPFQVFSAEKVDYLQSLIPAELTRRLKEKGGFTIVAPEALQPTPADVGIAAKELALIAKRTDAAFLVYGSLTKIDENLSIDARVFSANTAGSPYKDFVEGKDFESLVETLARKISDHIAKVAPPPAAAPAVAVPPSPGEPVPSPPTPEAPLAPPAAAPASESPDEAETAASVAPEIASVAAPESIAESPAPRSEENNSTPGQKSLVPKSRFRSDQPINITADRLEADNRAGTVNFLGNVVAKREDMVIFSDRITAFYTKEGRMQKIDAKGNVKINQSDRMATCHEARYDQPAQKIILTGKPKVWQGNNIVSGQTITILLNEDKIIIDKGKEDRVNATIYPMEKGSPGAGEKP